MIGNNAGSRLRAIMDFQGVSVHELHRRTGLTRNTIRNISRDGVRGALDTWIRVSDALNVPLDYMARGVMA